MRWRPVAGVLLRQYYLLRSSPTRMLPMIAWVTVDIVLWGFITRYLNSTSGGKIDFVPNLLGAVLFWDFFTRVMLGVTMAFLEDVWSRNFINVFATPLLISEYVTGLVLTSIATSLIGLVLMLVLATTLFGLPLLSLGLLLIPFLLVLFLFGIALGIFASALVLRLGPASEWVVWPIPALLSPFAGVFYPITTLPDWMQMVSRLLPPSYVFEGMRAVIAGHAFSVRDLIVGVVLAVVEMVLAARLFSRIYRHVVRSGLLARYSAESVS
jgi:ABC-2 type transport system permease protein